MGESIRLFQSKTVCGCDVFDRWYALDTTRCVISIDGGTADVGVVRNVIGSLLVEKQACLQKATNDQSGSLRIVIR